MKITVNGVKYYLRIQHHESTVKLSEQVFPCRATTVGITPVETAPFVGTLECTAKCSPKKQFQRREGRKRAAGKLLQLPVLRKAMADKKIRRELFLSICPEFVKTANGKIKKVKSNA